MKSFITLISAVALSLALANCGKKGGSAPSEEPKATTTGATQIAFTNPNNVKLVWSNNANDFYIPYSDTCRKSLATQANDPKVSDAYAKLIALINTGTISAGTGASTGTGIGYLTLIYSDGTNKVVYLTDASNVTSDRLVISNHAEITNYLVTLQAQVNQAVYYCGKSK
ncbi:MAG: hypothetical protein KDD33_01965 [Bdellovibrionales bacterium]|nr:hypothetical protein [Bdellovibrionales bacterium]